MKGLRPEGKPVLTGVAFDDLKVPNMGNGTMRDIVMNRQQIPGSAHNGMEYLVEALQIAASGKVEAMVDVFPRSASTRPIGTPPAARPGFVRW